MEVKKCSDQEKLCLKLPISELIEAVQKTTKKSIISNDANLEIFSDIEVLDEEFMCKIEDFIRSKKGKIDNSLKKSDEKANQIVEILHNLSIFLSKKTEIDGFLEKNQETIGMNSNIFRMMMDNQMRIRDIRSKLPTTPTSETGRSEEVLNRLTEMMHVLPLNENERVEMDEEIQRIIRNSQLTGLAKCEMIAMHLMALVGTWNNNQNSQDLDDSNLTDVDGEMRAARVIKAINEPYHIDTWSSASRFSYITSSSSACSEDVAAQRVPPRSSDILPDSSTTSVNFSTISLREMIGEAMDNVKQAAETQATSVLKTLQKSVFSSGEKIES